MGSQRVDMTEELTLHYTVVERASQVARVVKNLPANAGDLASILGWGRSPAGGHGNPLRYSCLENPMDRGAWRATAHGIPKVSDVTERLSIQDKSDFFYC